MKTTGVEELWEGVAPRVQKDSTEVRKPASHKRQTAGGGAGAGLDTVP